MQNSNKRAFRLAAAFAATLAATTAGAVDIVSGDWKFSVNGNINLDYIYSRCQSASSAEKIHTVGGACPGAPSGSHRSNRGNAPPPPPLTLRVRTTPDRY